MFNQIFKKLSSLSTGTLHTLLVLSGLLIALQVNYIQHGSINNDAILYLEAAKLFSEGEWSKALGMFNWPLYSILIAAVHTITSLEIHTSAQTISILNFTIATASFLKIIQQAGGDNRTMLTGALVLFSSQYIVGDALGMLLRDQGFWAFFLTSLVFFIRYYQSHLIKDALLWQITAMVAMLFRIEAITYLAGLPVLFLLIKEYPFTVRIKLFFKAHILNIVLGLSLIIAAIYSGIDIESFGRLNEVFSTNLYHELTQTLYKRAEIMASQVLGNYLEEFAMQGILLTFIFVIIAKVISATGWLTTGLALLSISTKTAPLKPEVPQILNGVMIIATINMSLIITKVFVLSGRYVVALSWVLMIFAAFYLAYLLRYLTSDKKQDQLKKWLAVLVLSIMVLSTVKNVLPKKAGYNYEQDAISWIKENNPKNLPVFYETPRLRYYADAPYIGLGDTLNWESFQEMVSTRKIQEFEFLLITINKNSPERKIFIQNNLSEYSEVVRFNNTRNKKSVVIYRKNDE